MFLMIYYKRKWKESKSKMIWILLLEVIMEGTPEDKNIMDLRDRIQMIVQSLMNL